MEHFLWDSIMSGWSFCDWNGSRRHPRHLTAPCMFWLCCTGLEPNLPISAGNLTSVRPSPVWCRVPGQGWICGPCTAQVGECSELEGSKREEESAFLGRVESISHPARLPGYKLSFLCLLEKFGIFFFLGFQVHS